MLLEIMSNRTRNKINTIGLIDLCAVKEMFDKLLKKKGKNNEILRLCVRLVSGNKSVLIWFVKSAQRTCVMGPDRSVSLGY